MKVNGLNCQTYTARNFGNINKSNTTLNTSVDYTKENQKLLLSLAALSAAGAAFITSFIAKDNNTTALNLIKETTNDIYSSVSNKPKPDELSKLLNGKRNADAINKYKVYIAQKKLDSLQRKILNGEFNNKPKEVYSNLIKNKNKLEKTINCGLNKI